MIDGLIIDSFAGGGGASTGIELALGRSPDIAVNHDREAIAMHQANHPNTRHLQKSIWAVNMGEEIGTRPVALAWYSPDCKHFSKAKGGKPVKASIRDLAWVVIRDAKTIRPVLICLENVEEFQGWGPLIQAVDKKTGEPRFNEDGTAMMMPDPARKGQTFRKWMGELRRLGYRVEWRELRACDYGAPTIRKRFFMVARRDGRKIVWPEPTHGDPKSEAVKSGRLKPWVPAADIIDWSLPCHSIFLSKEEGRALGVKRPLEEATMARIAKGVKRYVIDAAEPFIVNLTHQGGDRSESVSEPFRTVTGAHRGEKAVVVPHVAYAQQGGAIRDIEDPLHTVTASPKDQNTLVGATLVGCGGRAGQSRPRGIDEPIHTVTAKGDTVLAAAHLMTMRNAQKPHNQADAPAHTICAEGAHLNLVSAFLAQHNIDGRTGEGNPGRSAVAPVSTVTASGAQQGVVAASMLNLKGSDRRMSEAGEPAPTVCSGGYHIAAVEAFMIKYYGSAIGHELTDPAHSVTSKPRFGMVTVTIGGEPYVIVDIGMRMLVPRELFGAQSFPPSYIIDRGLFEQPDGSFEWKPLTKTAQIRMCGNSVPPVLAQALIAANWNSREMHVRQAKDEALETETLFARAA